LTMWWRFKKMRVNKQEKLQGTGRVLRLVRESKTRGEKISPKSEWKGKDEAHDGGMWIGRRTLLLNRGLAAGNVY